MTATATPTDAEILAAARHLAEEFGEPAPRTVEDVERLTGTAYYGPAPEVLDVPRPVAVQRPPL